MSRLCPGLPDFAALSRNPARLHKWRCGTSINYRVSVRISRCLVGAAVHNRPKVGVVAYKLAWSVKFRTRFVRIHSTFYSVPVSPLINLATMMVLLVYIIIIWHYYFVYTGIIAANVNTAFCCCKEASNKGVISNT